MAEEFTFTAHSSNIEEWTDERGLTISASKSTITLFTTQFAQCNTHPQVTLNNFIQPLRRTPCILGVTFDPHFKFNDKSLVTRALSRINILKALAGTNWGQTRNHAYHLCIPFHVCSSIWFPNTSPTLIQKFQTIHNSALRIATGCVRITSIDHLHEETKMLPMIKITFL